MIAWPASWGASHDRRTLPVCLEKFSPRIDNSSRDSEILLYKEFVDRIESLIDEGHVTSDFSVADYL